MVLTQAEAESNVLSVQPFPSPAHATGLTYRHATITPDVTALDGTWWIGATVGRLESRLVYDLNCLGIPCFLPLICRKIEGNRFVQVPTFCGYVFFCGSVRDRWDFQNLALDRKHLRKSHGVLEVLPEQRERLVDELRQIQIVMERDPTALRERCPLRPGDRVRVVRGNARGVYGTLDAGAIRVDSVIEKKTGLVRVVLAVTMFARGTPLEVDAGDVELVT